MFTEDLCLRRKQEEKKKSKERKNKGSNVRKDRTETMEITEKIEGDGNTSKKKSRS